MPSWEPVTEDEARGLERELARELPPGHVLAGLRVTASARRLDCDDVAFVLDDGRICIVHLTWSKETDPSWPSCHFVAALPEALP